VVSKYPDMSRVQHSALQKLEQGLSAQAVAYAQEGKRRAKYEKKLKGKGSVHHAAIKNFMLKANKNMRKK
jgi:hypothetical protein